MESFSLKRIAVSLAVLAGVGVGIFLLIDWMTAAPEAPRETVPEETAEPEPDAGPAREVIGTSIEGRTIEAFVFGSGETELLFVGGIHGGYEWNSVLLAYEMVGHLEANPEAVPDGVSVTIIPSLNPDGVYAVLGIEGRFTAADVPAGDASHGRFNARGVDLNRNFDCKWAPESTWRGEAVSAGTAPFSEPEAAALRDFVLAETPDAVVFWHSQASAVYASECEDGILPETLAVMETYANAAGYRAVESFDAYPITGDAEGWLASLGIPAVSVELTTHETIEWEKNLAGFNALLSYYTNGDTQFSR